MRSSTSLTPNRPVLPSTVFSPSSCCSGTKVGDHAVARDRRELQPVGGGGPFDLHRSLGGVERPAGQGAGDLLDVLLRVVADAQREQFHQLAGVVLVGLGLVAPLQVEIGHHGRVERHRFQERAEVAQGVAAVGLILLVERLRKAVTLPVAEVKWPCQNSVITSRSGALAVIIS